MSGHHGHFDSAREGNRKRLAGALVLTTAYMIAEFIGALLTNSLALLADAGHMFSDVAALGLSLFAAYITGRPATSRQTYGYYRTEILAALVNGSALLAISVFIFIEAYQRFQNPPQVKSGLMLIIAAGGLAVNLISLRVLSGGKSENLNVRGAWLHVLADALGSIGAICSALVILTLGWKWADPLASVLIACLVVFSSISLLKEAVAVVMESAPRGLNVDDIRDAIISLGGVAAIHDLHVWSITTGMVCLSAHVVIRPSCDQQVMLTSVRDLLRDRFEISHVTIQIERQQLDDQSSQQDCIRCTN